MKKLEIITIVLAALAVLVSVFYVKQNNPDALKFKEEYESINGVQIENSDKKYMEIEINKKNPIKYASIDEIKKIIKSGTGIIYFGFPECPWCRNALPVLLEVAEEMHIKTIYYNNALSIRDKKKLVDGEIVVEEEGTEEYKELVELMYDELPVYNGLEDDTIKRLYFPTVVFIKEGKIIGLHTSTVESQKDPYKALTKDEKEELKSIYTDYINEVYDILCDGEC